MDEDLDAARGMQVYAPPTLADEGHLPGPTEAAARAGYRRLGVWAWSVTLSFGLAAALHGIGALASVVMATAGNDFELSRRTFAGYNELVIASQVPRVLALLSFYGLLVLANKNARAFARAQARTNEQNAETHEHEPDDSDENEDDDTPDSGRAPRARSLSIGFFSPASMVWWYFVPVMNLFRPYQALLSVWRTSRPLLAEAEPEVEALPRRWWAFWLGSSFLLLVSPLRAQLGLSYVTRDLILLTVSLAEGASCLMTIVLARALDRRQRRRAAEQWS